MKTLLLNFAFVFISFASFAQIGVIENLDGGVPVGWSNQGANFFGSNLQSCTGNSIRANVWGTGASSNSTLTTVNYEGLSNGTDLNISFDYKIVDWSAATDATAPGWGFFDIEYSTDAGDNWTLLETIDDDNHVTSNECATLSYTIDAVDIPEDSDFQFRIFIDRQGGDFYFYLDSFSFLQTSNDSPNCDAVLDQDGLTDFPIEGNISWTAATGLATEYFLTVGTTPGGNDVVDNVSTGLATSYNFAEDLDYETTYYVNIIPSNENGDADDADCQEFSFTTEDDPSQTIDCNEGPFDGSYCYGNNDNTTFDFTSNDGSSLNITFDSGNIEQNYDNLIVFDSDGSVLYDFNDEVPGFGNFDVSGLTFQSSGDSISFQITSDGSVGCDSSATYFPIEYTVSCATCTNPQVNYELVSDCQNGPQFFIDVDVTDLGDANSLEITDNQDEYTETVTETGVVQIGPFDNGTDVVITVQSLDDVNCNSNSPTITQEICSEIFVDCDAGPITETYCYANNEDYEITYVSDNVGPLNLTINAGFVEVFFDEFVVLDTDGTQLASLDGNISGNSFQSTGDELTVLINSDGSVNCQGNNYEEIEYTIACATCINPQATYEVVDDCDSGTDQFFVDIDVTDMGDATSLEVTDNQDDFTETVTETGLVTFGPYPNGTDVQITIENLDDANCIISSQSLTQEACPPANSSCDDAEVAVVNDGSLCVELNEGTLFEATSTSVPSSCHPDITQDVWYEFEATAETHMTTIINPGFGAPLGSAIYENDCGDLAELYCSSEFDNFGNSNSMVAEGLTIGETYYVRVYSFGTENLNFDLCITTPEFFEDNVLCSDIEPFCAPVDDEGNPTALVFPNTYYYNETTPPEDGPDYGCLFTQPNPAWFYVTVQESGDLEFEIVQSTAFDADGVSIGQTLDVDFIAYGPFDEVEGNCENLTEANTVDCSYSAAAVEDMVFPDAEAGEIYIVVITNFNQAAGYISLTQTNLGQEQSGSTSCDDVFGVRYGCASEGFLIESEIEGADAYAWFEVLFDEEGEIEDFVLIDGEDQPDLFVEESGVYRMLHLSDPAIGPEEVFFDVRLAPEVELDPELDLSPDEVNEINICEGDSLVIDGMPINLDAYEEMQHAWLDENGAVLSTDPTHSISEEGEYSLHITSFSSGFGTGLQECLNTFDFIVQFTEFDIDLGGDQEFCDVEDSQTITANVEGDFEGEVNYEWSTGETTQSIEVSETNIYTVTIDIDGCIDSASVEYIFNESPVIDLPEELINCDLTNQTLNATPQNTDVELTLFQWFLDGELIEGENLESINLATYGHGLYEVEAYSDSEDCVGSASTFVGTQELSIFVDDDSDNLYCVGETVNLTAMADGMQIDENSNAAWFVNDQQQEASGFALDFEVGSVTGTMNDVDRVRLVVGECEAEMDIERYPIENCIVPQGLSPGGMNPSLDLRFLNDRSGISKLQIFNRYGKKVFQQNNYENSFVGQDKGGTNLVTGTYFLVIKFTQPDPVYGSEYKGWLYINREQ